MTHHTDAELLPCPFCGCKPKLEGTGLIRWIKCHEDSECGSSGMAMGIAANDLSRGIAAWNRRANPPACNPSMQPELATYSAPVQLPEYGIDTANHAGIRVRGYTEQQVRELLAAHGIQEQST